MSVQYRVVVGKKDERVDGPDDADIVFTSPVEIARAPGFDATVEFMTVGAWPLPSPIVSD